MFDEQISKVVRRQLNIIQSKFLYSGAGFNKLKQIKFFVIIILNINISKVFQMGNMVNNRISPNLNRKKQNRLKNNPNLQVSRRNFRFVSKISTTGYNNQSILWLAQNWENPSQQFFIKKTSKYLAYRHGRVESIKNELRIFTKQNNISFMIQPQFAFQDYSSLYIVYPFIDGFTLEEVLREHVLTEDEARYIVLGLINIIERLHQQKFAITELSPQNIIIDRKTGEMKLFQLVNPLPIDSYYPSNMIIPLNSYVAPEILLMDRVLAESDYYSLGLILYFIMKNKPAIPPQISQNRTAIISENIEVVKSDLPQNWKTDAPDFLMKLLIKNPELRLGRYGSFEVRNHEWLKNYSYTHSCTTSNINLVQDYFKQKKYERIKKTEVELPQKQEMNQSYEFQIQFQNYSYRINDLDNETISYDSIQEQY